MLYFEEKNATQNGLSVKGNNIKLDMRILTYEIFYHINIRILHQPRSHFKNIKVIQEIIF